jgi:membrane associated rhomboid family serine protease
MVVFFYAIAMILIEILDQSLGGLLDAIFPIVPRSDLLQLAKGIIGAPFSHVGIDHLSGNLIAFFPLSFLIILKGDNFHRVWGVLSVFAGLGTWLIGVPGTAHIGASGVIFGQWSYLLTAGIFHADINSILSAILCGAWLWRMYFSLINMSPGISWEGHASGVVAGIITAIFFRGFVCSEKSKVSFSR